MVENDQGEVVREFMKDTDAINLYKNMRETLGELQLHVIRMKDLFLKKLWSPDQGNKESHRNLKKNSFNLAPLIITLNNPLIITLNNPLLIKG